MRTGTLIEQIARQAGIDGGIDLLTPDGAARRPLRGVPANADVRWRPAPDPATGVLHVDPEFSLPTTAGPLNFRLYYDAQNSRMTQTWVNGEWGFAWHGSFPPRIKYYVTGVEADVLREDGQLDRFQGDAYLNATVWTKLGRHTGDTLTTLTDNTWRFTDAGTGYRYHFTPANLDSVIFSCVYRETPFGERITYNYLANGRLQSIQDPIGRRVTLSYNADGKVQTVEDWGDRGLMVMTYVGTHMSEVWQQEGVMTRYRYDFGVDGYLTEIIDPAGYRTTYTYSLISDNLRYNCDFR